MHRPRDVFEALLADIGELGVDLAAHLAERVLGDADATELGDAFEASSDVDAIPVDVAILDDDVAEIDPDPERDLPFCAGCGVPLCHCALDAERAGRRLDDTGKLDEQSVAHRLDDAPVVLADFRIDELAVQRLEALEGAFLVRPHQPE